MADHVQSSQVVWKLCTKLNDVVKSSGDCRLVFRASVSDRMQKQQDGCVKMAVYVSNAHNTVFGSKRSRLLVAHRGHLKLEIQTAF